MTIHGIRAKGLNMSIKNILLSILFINFIPVPLLYAEGAAVLIATMAPKVADAAPGILGQYFIGGEKIKNEPILLSKIDELASGLATAKIEIAVSQEKDKNTNIKIENAILHATADAQRAHAELEQKLTTAQLKAAEDAAKLDKAVKVAVFTGVVSTIYVAKSVYDWTRPATSDERAWREYVKSQAGVREQAARRALDFMKSEREFKPCVVDYAKSARRADGIPMACRESADEYV